MYIGFRVLASQCKWTMDIAEQFVLNEIHTKYVFERDRTSMSKESIRQKEAKREACSTIWTRRRQAKTRTTTINEDTSTMTKVIARTSTQLSRMCCTVE